MTRALLVGLLLALGCSGTAPAEDPRLHPTLGLDPTISDLSLSAIVMWERATGGLYAPDVHLGCDGSETYCIRELPGMLAECGEVGTVNGCCDTPAHEIRLSESMYLDQKISTLAHELGHSLGLAHGTGVTLMNPGRGRDARHSPCVDQAALDAFASEYGAATLPVVCYGDDVRQEALARYEDLAHPERQ